LCKVCAVLACDAGDDGGFHTNKLPRISV
jgi:hypothetical protein